MSGFVPSVKPALLVVLQALSGPTAGELQAVVNLLADAPVIWTGAGFTAIDRVAFRCQAGPCQY